MLSDGDAGLRAIQRAAAPEAEPVLDWFHIAMRWQHVHQLASGAIHQGQPAEARTWLLDRIDRAKWALWNGQLSKTLGHLSDLRVWTWNVRADPSWLEHLRTHLSELTAYLDANADSLPNYGARHRQGAAISTAFVESAVNEIVSRRMVKRQQMRWNRETVDQDAQLFEVAGIPDTQRNNTWRERPCGRRDRCRWRGRGRRRGRGAGRFLIASSIAIGRRDRNDPPLRTHSSAPAWR